MEGRSGQGVALDTRTPDAIRDEINRISALVIQLSAKAEDLSQALATVTEKKRRLSLKLLKLDAELKQAGEVSG